MTWKFPLIVAALQIGMGLATGIILTYGFLSRPVIEQLEYDGKLWCHPQQSIYFNYNDDGYYYLNQKPKEILFYNRGGVTSYLLPCK